MNKRPFIIVTLLLFVSVMMIIFPALGRFDFEQYKQDSLTMWHKQVLMFKDSTGRLPNDLYEVYLFYKDEIDLENFPIRTYRHLSKDRRELLKKDPANFLEMTYYEYAQDEQHWYVKEKYPENHGTILFINEQGQIMRENRDTGSIEKVKRKSKVEF